MRLDKLFYQIPILERRNWEPSKEIHKITSDSRAIEANDIFVACSGTRMDGHDFLVQAIHDGASVIVYEQLPDLHLPKEITAIKVSKSSECLALLLQRFYGNPQKKLKLVGITGTNGKSTVAYLLQRLVSSKVKAAYIGTLGYQIGDEFTPSPNTTPGPEIMIPLFNEMIQRGIEYCFVEVSSHALDQRRVFGLPFEVAVFTQLTQDHLDYHKTMERYYQTKRLLFSQSPMPKKMLINSDCPYGRRMLDENLHAKKYSISGLAHYFAANIECTLKGSYFEFMYRGGNIPFNIHLPMRHNVSNAVASLGVLELLGFDVEDFRAEFQEFPGVPGRMERIVGAKDFEVFVDYAHTPDAFEHVLGEARRLKPKRILTLFGCGGDRDQEKRAIMAQALSTYSDYVIMTSDNPRSENPEDIISDMRKGISKGKIEKDSIFEILDRREAIWKLISLAEPGDVLMVLGKGHEDYQILGEKKVPFDDREVIKDCLKRNSRVFFS